MCEWEQHWKKWYIQFHVLSLKLWWLKILQDFSNPFGSLALPSIFPVKVKNSGEWYLRWGYLDLASWLKKLFIYSLLLTLTTEEKQATGNVLFSFLVYTKIVCSVTGGTQFFLFFLSVSMENQFFFKCWEDGIFLMPSVPLIALVSLQAF